MQQTFGTLPVLGLPKGVTVTPAVGQALTAVGIPSVPHGIALVKKVALGKPVTAKQRKAVNRLPGNVRGLLYQLGLTVRRKWPVFRAAVPGAEPTFGMAVAKPQKMRVKLRRLLRTGFEFPTVHRPRVIGKPRHGKKGLKALLIQPPGEVRIPGVIRPLRQTFKTEPQDIVQTAKNILAAQAAAAEPKWKKQRAKQRALYKRKGWVLPKHLRPEKPRAKKPKIVKSIAPKHVPGVQGINIRQTYVDANGDVRVRVVHMTPQQFRDQFGTKGM